MTFDEIYEIIPQLTIEQRKTLLAVIIDSFTEGTKTYDILDFEGIGKHLYDGTDAQEQVNQLRQEWDQPA